MKRMLIGLATVIFLCGCTTFGSFSNLEKGKSSQEEVLSMLGEPSAKSYEDDKEIWQYYFIKKIKKKPGNLQTILNVNVIFKNNTVYNYIISVSKETIQKMPSSTQPFSSPKNQRGSFINKFDLNNDGRVSKDEFFGPPGLFNKLDRNNDGFIDADEAPKGPPPSGRRGRR